MRWLMVVLCLLVGSHGFAGDNGFPFPPPENPLDQVEYNKKVYKYLKRFKYRTTPGWVHDTNWRLTGKLSGTVTVDADGNITDAAKTKQYGVHIPCRIYYSPEVDAWMKAGYPDDAIPDGAVIIKEGTGWGDAIEAVAATVPTADRTGTKVVESVITEELPVKAWVVMVRHSASSFDGWYWFDFSNADTFEEATLPYGERSAVSPDRTGMPPEPTHNWYVKNPADTPSYFTGNTSGEIVYPSYQYGYYCINCHASAINNSTFSYLGNVEGPGETFPALLTFQTTQATPGLRTAEKTPHKGDEEVTGGSGQDHLDNPYTPPLEEPNQLFLDTFTRFAPWESVSWREVWDQRFPAKTYDHAPAAEKADRLYVSADQCQGCHDASILNSKTPNMVLPDGHVDINLSPFGEWQASMMGLAGRDPIFFAQLESEQTYFPKKADEIANTCLRCHGGMGQRQFHIDRKAAGKKEAFFTRAMVAAWPGSDSSEDAVLYGALARDGISCALCHHITEKGLGEPSTFTGNFNSGPPDELYGPFDNVIPKPMENALGITPKHGDYFTDSKLCGSCHAIVLPILDTAGNKVGEGFEQTTYLEWLNSDFAPKKYGKKSSAGQSCQDCHMPNSYHLSDGTEQTLDFRIANIEASTVGGLFPHMERALPNEDLTLKNRPGYARHMLAGINLFGLEMFRQFPLILGVMQSDYMVGTQQSLVTAQQSGLRLARRETADLAVSDLSLQGNQLKATVTVTNKAGHFMPSGVGFRRAFLRFEVLDGGGHPLWVSGAVNGVGVLVDDQGLPLPTEFFLPDTRLGLDYQPAYEEINFPYQVQIYQELAKNTAGQFTTSFLQIYQHVKDNRLRPKGWSPKGPFAEETRPHGAAAKDPFYTDPKKTGRDQVVYKIDLNEDARAAAAQVRVSLFYQAIPPFYLMQRFQAANPDNPYGDAKRLFFMASYLNTNHGDAPLEDWSLQITSRRAAIPGR